MAEKNAYGEGVRFPDAEEGEILDRAIQRSDGTYSSPDSSCMGDCKPKSDTRIRLAMIGVAVTIVAFSGGYALADKRGETSARLAALCDTTYESLRLRGQYDDLVSSENAATLFSNEVDVSIPRERYRIEDIAVPKVGGVTPTRRPTRSTTTRARTRPSYRRWSHRVWSRLASPTDSAGLRRRSARGASAQARRRPGYTTSDPRANSKVCSGSQRSSTT